MIKTFNYKDIIEYSYRDKIPWKVREVVHEMRWEIEAYYDDYINSRLIRVVFYTDIIEPNTKLREHEFRLLIDNINIRYLYIKERYGQKNI